MSGKIHVAISEQLLDLSAAQAFIADPAHGAQDFFIGAVRNLNMWREVRAVSYDVFVPLAENTLREMAEEIRDNYAHKVNIYVEHYKGRLEVEGVSVIIAVSTPHRAESFTACRELIEELKHRAPIWKQEHYVDGDSDWVQGHALCGHG